jgi:hypothetical protein
MLLNAVGCITEVRYLNYIRQQVQTDSRVHPASFHTEGSFSGVKWPKHEASTHSKHFVLSCSRDIWGFHGSEDDDILLGLRWRHYVLQNVGSYRRVYTAP